MKNVTLRQLRVFTAVARHLSFVRAAADLKITAPAVSMQIKELELEVGLPLLDRTSRQVSLTTVGEYVLAHALRVLAAMRDAEDLVARFRGLRTGPLDVGMVSTAEYFLPRLLARFRDEHPGIEIRLRVADNRQEMIALMQRADIELAVMGRPPDGWPTRAEPFALHPHVLITAPAHPFTRLKAVRSSALSGEAFIVREPGSGTRAVLDEYVQARRISLQVAMQMSSNEAVKQAVMAGMGVSLLSLHTVDLELKHGLLAVPDVEGLPLMRRWHVVNNSSKTLSPAAEAFRVFVLDHGEAFLAEQFAGAHHPTASPSLR